MRRRFFAMGADLALVAGCASTNPPDQWSAKVDVDPFTECMKAKGYTVTQ